MSMDFNDADPQGSTGIIPDGTVAPVIINLRGIKPGKSDSRVKGLDLEFTVIEGPFKGRKAWKWAGIAGSDSEGHKTMVSITRSSIRAMLESAYGVDPADDSPEAMNGRRLADWEDLTGMAFVARFSVEAGTDYTDAAGNTKKGKDKNDVRAVTPDDPAYTGFKPAKPKAKGVASTAAKPANGAATSKEPLPSWAR